jgi:hypothetical protein
MLAFINVVSKDQQGDPTAKSRAYLRYKDYYPTSCGTNG